MKPGHDLKAMSNKLMGGSMPKVEREVLYPKILLLSLAQAFRFRPPPALVTMKVGKEVLRYKVEARQP